VNGEARRGAGAGECVSALPPLAACVIVAKAVVFMVWQRWRAGWVLVICARANYAHNTPAVTCTRAYNKIVSFNAILLSSYLLLQTLNPKPLKMQINSTPLLLKQLDFISPLLWKQLHACG
jgi:hypothetical protein